MFSTWEGILCNLALGRIFVQCADSFIVIVEPQKLQMANLSADLERVVAYRLAL